LVSLVLIETIQWVTQLVAGKIFLCPFPWRSKRQNGRLWSWHAEAQDCSWAELNLVSDFLQEIIVPEIVVRAVRLNPISKISFK
jgi:hypothetical protein